MVEIETVVVEMGTLNRSRLMFLVAFLICATAAAPSFGWLYDGGEAQHAGVIVRDNSSVVWAAAPFSVSRDSYATSVGAALARAVGPEGSGFDVYLTQSMLDLRENAFASWKVAPADPVLDYYYHDLSSPVFLRADTAYLLVFVPDSPDFWGTVSYSKTGYYGWGSGDYGDTWSALPLPLCVRVDGTPATPEPTSAAVVFIGLGSCIIFKRGKR